jgi:putative transposase
MARRARLPSGGVFYHALNRGYRHGRIFHDRRDYGCFLRVLHEVATRLGMSVQAFCLLPNHFHLLLFPALDKDLSRFMHLLTTKQVAWHNARHGTAGYVWQGRFRSFAVQTDRYLLAAAAYVERNALTAGLVSRAEDWAWGSAHVHATGRRPQWLLPPLEPVERWLTRLNERQSDAEVAALRHCVRRSLPFGAASWRTAISASLGLPPQPPKLGRPKRRRP